MSAELVFSGKAYSKAMRSHKITVQALWRILMPKVMSFLQENNSELHNLISSVMKDDNEIAATCFHFSRRTILQSFGRICYGGKRKREFQVLVAVYRNGFDLAFVHTCPERRYLGVTLGVFPENDPFIHALRPFQLRTLGNCLSFRNEATPR